MRRYKKPNNGKSEQLAETTAEKQLEKLSLEIEQMKNKSKWHDRVAPYISLLTVIITVGGFVFGIVQFRNQQDKNRSELEKQRSDDIQKRYENTLDKLLQFTRDEKITVATAINLLTNLKTQIKEKAAVKEFDKNPAPESIAEEEQRIKRTVSYMLAELIKNDCNLDNSRDVSFLTAVLYNWEDFQGFLRQNPDNIEFILDQQQQALSKIYSMDNSIIKEVTFDIDENLFSYPNGYGKIENEKIVHFQDMVHSYKLLYDLIANDKTSERMLIEFQSAICNRELTQQLFGKSLEQEGNDEFAHCVEE